MKAENLPDASVRLVVVNRQDGSAACRVQTLTREGAWFTHYQTLWSTGRPTPNQWDLTEAKLLEAARQVVSQRYGFVGLPLG